MADLLDGMPRSALATMAHAIPKLEPMAETNFRQQYQLSPTASLAERSFTFPGNRFRIHNNFGIGEEWLGFLNTYEIGPGAYNNRNTIFVTCSQLTCERGNSNAVPESWWKI